ncbi:MAG: HAMP domain-containing histidine kinase [Bacteroidales bacterium]|nr:HAMP domain-containing histidine kinase [Bacteroidales bacterium]MDD3286269.1 HAMP domain-containing sensor histidine kinase [Bacteroidales bacterium]
MKNRNLLTSIILRTTITITIILSVWASLVFFAIINEVNDEIDDSLDLYCDYLISQKKQGKEIIETQTNSNNVFFITPVDINTALSNQKSYYRDTMIYLYDKMETEPARALTQYFIDEENRAYKIEIFTSTIEKKDLIETIAWWLFTLALILLLTIIIVYVWIYKKSMKPLYLLLNWQKNYNLGKKNQPLPQMSSIKEFQELYIATNQSTQRVEKAFEEQKNFIGNASHEIQTPLAISINRLENILNQDISEELAEEIVKTISTLEHLTRLNKTLLLLTKIENNQFLEKENLSLASIVNNSMEVFKEIYEYKSIKLSIEVESDLNVNINKTLCEVLINNLIKNAFIHNIENGEISIKIYSNKIVFSNTSKSNELDAEKIFQRFFKESSSNSSIGLGLSLVKSICNNNNIKLDYYWQNNLHNFCLCFFKC